MTEKELWKLVEDCNWSLDHDYDRIRVELSKLPSDVVELFDEFINDKHNILYERFEKDWLGNPGIDCSDDGFMDLRAEVVGRGEKFYNSITTDKLREMCANRDYYECFLYVLHDL